MRNVEITTTQNVTIQYELAEVKDRIFAFLIDRVIIFAFYFLLLLSFNSILKAIANENWMVIILVGSLIIFYTLFFETLMNGSTPGKKILGIRVVKLNGKEAQFKDFFIRWTLRMFDIFLTSGAAAVLLISSGAKAQRLGDILAGTLVVKEKVTEIFSLQDIVNLNNNKDYQLSYPEVKDMQEEEMLLIKQLLLRHRKHGNETYKDLINTTANQIKTRLNIQDKNAKPELFLNTLIKDYVYITRQ